MSPINCVFDGVVQEIISEYYADLAINPRRGQNIADQWLQDILDALEIIEKNGKPNSYPKEGNRYKCVTKRGKKILFEINGNTVIVKELFF